MPSVIVSIAHDKTRQQKEKVDCQVPVVDEFIDVACGKWLGEVKGYDNNCSDATESV
jgi:hypothetical protein